MKKIFTVLGVCCAILLIGQAHALSQTPAGSDFYYVGNTEECKLIDYMCEKGWNDFSDASGCGCKKMQDPDIVCTMEYAPVCGMPYFECPEGAVCSRPMDKTYGNKCMLEAEGAILQYEGVCEHDKTQACTEEWNPVCGKTQDKACMGPGCASEYKTYSNMCFLESDNATFQYKGECNEEVTLPEPTKTKYYVGDTQKCEVIRYACDDGWEGFTDTLGCGCEKRDTAVSEEIQSRIHTIVETFVSKLEVKGYSDEEIVHTMTLLIIKIEVLKQEKPHFTAILNYTIEVLETFIQKYEDDLNIIEKIFQGY